MNNYVCPKGFATQKVWAALCKFAGTDTAYSLGPTDCYRWNRFVMAASRKNIPLDVTQLVDILITQFHFPHNVAWKLGIIFEYEDELLRQERGASVCPEP